MPHVWGVHPQLPGAEAGPARPAGGSRSSSGREARRLTLDRYSRVKRGFFGGRVSALTLPSLVPNLGKGAAVVAATRDGIAERSGVRPWQVVVKVDRHGGEVDFVVLRLQ